MSLATPTVPSQGDEREMLRGNWGLFLIFGLVSIIAGFMAISSTFVATMATVTVFGVLLLIAGATEVVHAVMVRNLKGFALHLLSAALYLLVGLFMLEDPLHTALILTLILAASFLVGGLLRVIFAFTTQPHGWQWVALNGGVDLVLGVMIWNRWPESSLWVIGLFVGIDLLMHGWSLVFLALTVKNYQATQAA